MSTKDYTNMQCHVFEDFNIVFDEKNSTCGVIRRAQWIKDGDEPDESKAKLEIRKIYNTSEGERSGKGYTFSTENGPDELVVGLIDAGFGQTSEILQHIKTRDNFKDAVQAIKFVNDDFIDEDGEIFDMRELLLNEEDGEAINEEELDVNEA